MSDYTATAFIDFTVKQDQVFDAEDIINAHSLNFPDSVSFKVGVTYDEKYCNISLVVSSTNTGYNVSQICNTVLEQIMDLVDEG